MMAYVAWLLIVVMIFCAAQIAGRGEKRYGAVVFVRAASLAVRQFFAHSPPAWERWLGIALAAWFLLETFLWRRRAARSVAA
jgi:hypothetical protein